MTDATIVAIVILAGVFLVLIVTIAREGVEAAIKIWNIMGALTGVAFGAITSFYFTKAVTEQKIAQLEEKNKAAEVAFSSALQKTETANEHLRTVASTLEEGKQLPKEERERILFSINQASQDLNWIEGAEN